MAKKILCILMMALPVHQAIAVPPASMQSSKQETRREESIRAKVEGLGVGAEIKFSSNEGFERSGRIEEISNEGFRLAWKDQWMTVNYRSVKALELIHPRYKAKGQVDPIQVRRVAVNAGLGKKVSIRLASNRKLTGKIQSIESDTFNIVDSRSGSLVSVPLEEVTEIGRSGMSTGARVAIWVSLSVAVGLLVIAVGAGTAQ